MKPDYSAKSHGSNPADEQRSTPLLATRPKLRFFVLASAALVTWVCVDSWLGLVFSRYPIGFEPKEPTALSYVVGWAIAAVAVVIVAVLGSWRQSRYLVLYLAISTVLLLASIVASHLFPEPFKNGHLMSTTAALVASSAMIAVALIFAASARRSIIDHLRLHLPNRNVAIASLLPIFSWVALNFLWQFTPFNPVVHSDAPDSVVNIHEALFANPLATIGFIAVLVPLGEEILFRGLIATYMRDATNVVVATVGSAALFALLHIDPQYPSINQVIYIFCMGVILAVSRFATKSIWPGTLLHAINNAWVASVAI